MLDKFFVIPRFLRFLVLLFVALVVVPALGFITYFSGVALSLVILSYLKPEFSFWIIEGGRSAFVPAFFLVISLLTKAVFIISSMLSESGDHWQRKERKEKFESLVEEDQNFNRYLFYLIKRELLFLGSIRKEEMTRHTVIFLTSFFILLIK